MSPYHPLFVAVKLAMKLSSDRLPPVGGGVKIQKAASVVLLGDFRASEVEKGRREIEK